MKKIGLAVLAAVAVLCMAGCGADEVSNRMNKADEQFKAHVEMTTGDASKEKFYEMRGKALRDYSTGR